MAKREEVAGRVHIFSGAPDTWLYSVQNSPQSPFTAEQTSEYPQAVTEASGSQGQWDQAGTQPRGEAPGQSGCEPAGNWGVGCLRVSPEGQTEKENVEHCSSVSSPLCLASRTVEKSMLLHILVVSLYALPSPTSVSGIDSSVWQAQGYLTSHIP